jgi:NAD/NADP transhydrogenase beta subunit
MTQHSHMNPRAASREWRLMHVLAAWTVASLALAIGFSTAYPEQVANSTESIAALTPFWQVARVLVGLGALAAMWLWLKMVGDYMRRSSQLRTSWGVALFMGLFVGALFYFWRVWRPDVSQRAHRHAA